jgi:hypothetical protein
VKILSTRRAHLWKSPARVSGIVLAAVAVGGLLVGAGVAYSTGVAAPQGTFVVPGDLAGNPLPTTLTVAGFTPTAPVFVEECDGLKSSTPGWDPSVNCDFGASPAPVTADSSGTATFLADPSDTAHQFTPFKGESPQNLFNCLAPHQLDPANGLPSFRNCQLRFSSAPSSATGDQVFLTLVLPDAPATTAAGSCSLGSMLASVKTGTAGLGMTDQTHDLSITSVLMKDVHTTPSTPLGGTCNGLMDSRYAKTGFTPVVPAALGTLHETAVALSVSGAGSCAWNAKSVGANGLATQEYALNGTLTLTFAETNSLTIPKPFKVSAVVRLTHNLDAPNLWDLSGRVTAGLSKGATLSGTVLMNPASKYGGTPVNVTSNVGYVPPKPWPIGYTGYKPDAISGHPSGCDDAVAGNTTSPAVTNASVVRTDAATVSSGSATVLDASITAADLHKPVSGTGIPANSFVGTVTPGVSFKLSSSDTSQADVLATAAGTSVKITTTPARNIKAQTGILTYQMSGSGITFNF